MVDWARDYTASTIWSCLAAHAAVLHVDGIERRPLAEKLFGVFDCEPAAAHPMTRGAELRTARSAFALQRFAGAGAGGCGYRILTRSAVAGVDMFARQERSFHLFLQGHPEYEAKRCCANIAATSAAILRGERDDYPAPAAGLFRRQSDGDRRCVSRARAARSPRAPHRQFSAGRA